MENPGAKISSGERPVVKKLFLHAQVPVLRVSLLQVRGQHEVGSRGWEKCVAGIRGERLWVRVAAGIAGVRSREVAGGRRQSDGIAPRRHRSVAGVVVERWLLETQTVGCTNTFFSLAARVEHDAKAGFDPVPFAVVVAVRNALVAIEVHAGGSCGIDNGSGPGGKAGQRELGAAARGFDGRQSGGPTQTCVHREPGAELNAVLEIQAGIVFAEVDASAVALYQRLNPDQPQH